MVRTPIHDRPTKGETRTLREQWRAQEFEQLSSDLEQTEDSIVDLSIQLRERKPPRDLLSEATELARQDLRSLPTLSERIRALWVHAFAARDLGASDVIESDFMQLANDVGLIRDLGRHGWADCQHVITWALIDRNPFGGDNG